MVHRRRESWSWWILERITMAKYNIQQHGIGWRGHLYNSFCNAGLPDGDIYQFGVWDGFSMQCLGYMVQHMPRQFAPRFFGFDVFTGMPVEETEPDKQRDEPGFFNLLKHYGVVDLHSALTMLKFDISTNLPSSSELAIIDGLVQNTLTPELVATHKFKPAFYVDMDMDIYTPTKLTLDFLIKNKIIVQGTIVGFDDWGQCYPQHPIYSFGESRAFKEVCDQYSIKAQQLCETENKGQTAFLINSITV